MLAASDLHVWYGSVPAVRGVSLAVDEGERVALLGRNGAGKSTTLRALAGLAIPREGRVSLDGLDVTRWGPDRRLDAGLALVPEGRGIFADLTVHENLAMGATRRRMSRSHLKAEVERVLDLFPLLVPRTGQRGGSLSGGEQQMLALARGLMGDPRVLLIDEPSLGLAPIIVQQLYELLASLCDDGLAVVVVEQYVDVALAFAHRAYVLDKGRIPLSGSAAELRASRGLIDVYMAAGG